MASALCGVSGHSPRDCRVLTHGNTDRHLLDGRRVERVHLWDSNDTFNDYEGTDMKHDLVIRNGMIVDGLGNPAYEGEVAVLG